MMRNLRWVQKRIDSLDPETQYNEIISLVANYQMRPMNMNLVYVQALAGTQVADGALIVATGKTVNRAEDRTNGTMDTFFTWLFNGTDSEATKKSVERLNRYHLSHAKKYPGYFDDNEGAVYATCSIGMLGPRLRETFGLSPQSDRLNTAWYNFLRDIAGMLRFEHGELVDFPKDYESMRAWVEEYEGREWPQLYTTRYTMKWMVQNFCDRMFPRPLHWFGRNLALFATPVAVRQRTRMPDPGRFTGAFARFVFRTMIIVQERFAPDPRVPLSVKMSSDEYRKKVAARTERMRRLHEQRLRNGDYVPTPDDIPAGTSRPELTRILEDRFANVQ